MSRRAALRCGVASAIFALALAQVVAADPIPTPQTPPAVQANDAPNIVIILLDDAGFAATSAFGGLASTPAFDALARDGIRYNRFHVSAVCSPTRAALLSGRNPHQVGAGQIPETAANYPGYNAVWPGTAVSLAAHLQSFGYSTAAFGKWHNTPATEWTPIGPFNRWPTGLGFDYFYGTMGTTSQWEPLLWRGTGSVAPPRTASQGYNLTTDLVDDAIAWLHTRETAGVDSPYFIYFATAATHTPHQVPEEWIAPYRGSFDAGWDALRPRILAQQRALGVVPDNAELAPRDPAIPAWDSLSTEERRVAARQMEVLAGFMTQTDHEIGRLVDAIRSGPGGDNSLIIFIGGDNGSSGEDGVGGCDDCPETPGDADSRAPILDSLGGPDHVNGSAAGWAVMNNTPFPGMKGQASDLGGIRVPLIVSWPGHMSEVQTVRTEWLNVVDIAPTIFDILNYSPSDSINGVSQLPFEGLSFAPSLESSETRPRHRIQYFETFGTRSIYEDGWMASLRYYLRPWGGRGHGPQAGADQWELYNLNEDFSQVHNVADENPRRLEHLMRLFDVEAQRNQVNPMGELHLWFEQFPSRGYGRSDFTYYPDAPLFAWDLVPDFQPAHRITASVVLRDGRGDGLLMSHGMRGRGFALYMRNGFLTYETEQGSESTSVTTSRRIRAGSHTLVAEVSAGVYGDAGTRVVKLYSDGALLAEGRVANTIEPFYGSATISIGAPRNSPVSRAYPSTFSGEIQSIQLHFQEP